MSDDVRPSRLTVLAGPTAVGKGSVAAYVREHHDLAKVAHLMAQELRASVERVDR